MAIIHQLKNTVVEKVTTGNAMRLKYHLSTIPESGDFHRKEEKVMVSIFYQNFVLWAWCQFIFTDLTAN